jgi:hypothetical protein
MIFSDEPGGPPDCIACQNRLYAYIEADLDGLDAAARFASVAAHLDSCLDCLEEYHELRALFLADRQGEFKEPPFEPIFDYSFLAHTHAPRLIWQSTEHKVSRLVAGIRIGIGRELAFFDQLPIIFSAEKMIMPALRNEVPGFWRQAQTLSLPSDEHDLSISLLIGPVSGDRASLGVLTTHASTGEYVGRARVSIRDSERRILLSELTRESGLVSFPHIGSGEYLLEVRYHSHAWELPVTLTLQDEDPNQ